MEPQLRSQPPEIKTIFIAHLANLQALNNTFSQMFQKLFKINCRFNCKHEDIRKLLEIGKIFTIFTFLARSLARFYGQ